MSEMTFDAAAQALASANQADSASSSPAPSEQAPVAAPEVDAGTTSTEDSFTNIDPNLLPPELQAQYRNMQGAFTRRMQEVSAMQKQYEGYGAPEEVEQAVQLMQAVQNDPVFVHQQLSRYLQENGLSPAEADAVAAEAVQAEASPDAGAEWEDNPEVDSLRRELDELKNWRQQQEQYAREEVAIGKIQREESDIRSRNPNFEQDDIDSIYQLAFAHDGNLLQAEKVYKSMQDRFATSFMNQKASVPAGVSSPPATGGAQQPRKFEGLMDPALDRAAEAALRAALSES